MTTTELIGLIADLETSAEHDPKGNVDLTWLMEQNEALDALIAIARQMRAVVSIRVSPYITWQGPASRAAEAGRF